MGAKTPVRTRSEFVVLLLACAIAAFPTFAQRGWHQGDTWLKWKESARESYVFGYFNGYSNRHDETCEPVQNEWQKEINTTVIANKITDYYRRYPEDREIDIAEVIEQLGNGLTVEQIHNYPFARHKPPASKVPGK
jgi:hypothetical protein